jgi:D-serine deaminase-like pyridoxal phosphate-dependent protein
MGIAPNLFHEVGGFHGGFGRGGVPSWHGDPAQPTAARHRFGDKGFQSAAFVLSRVVSRPGERVLTLDAGLTTIQVDGGRPHAQVLGLSALVGAPSQEHLMVTVQSGPLPAYGEPMLLVPRHVDTTLAQFDRVYLVGDGAVREAETVFRPF